MADTSSSEIEFVSRPATAPSSPVKPRRSGRDRRAPRSKDDLAAPAAEALRDQTDATKAPPTVKRAAGAVRATAKMVDDELVDRVDHQDATDDDEETLTDLRTTTKTAASRQASTSKVTLDTIETKRVARAGRDTLSPDPSRGKKLDKAALNSSLEVPRTSAPARKSMSRSPAPPSSSTGTAAAPRPSTSGPTASTASARPSTSTSTSGGGGGAPRRAPRAKPKRNSSSDEADDFFARSKKPNKPALRVPGRATATAATITAVKKVSTMTRGSSLTGELSPLREPIRVRGQNP